MPAFGLEPQIVMTTPLLEGLDGVEKMSKSLGNYVGVTDAPAEMFGKLMSISDELMWRYYTLLTDLTPEQIAGAAAARSTPASCIRSRPRSDLAMTIVRDFHGAAGGRAGGGGVRAPVARRRARGRGRAADAGAARRSSTCCSSAGWRSPGSEATRKVQQGAVRINGEKFTSVTDGGRSRRTRSCCRSAGRCCASSC